MHHRQKIPLFKNALRSCIFFLLFLAVGSSGPGFSGQALDREEEGRVIAAELRCVVCQNLSVADSPSEMAQQMRAIILEQLQEGKSPDEIKAYFVSKYGPWVLLSPPARGFTLLVWLLPFIALAAGLLAVVYLARRWVRKKKSAVGTETRPEIIRRLLQGASGELEGESREDHFRRALLKETARLRSELEDFEFDYQAGKLSETDYEDLRRDIEQQTGAIERELGSISPGRTAPEPYSSSGEPRSPGEAGGPARRGRIPAWKLAAGGVLLLALGIALGVLLTRSLKPRSSDQDSITGDFLTGTSPSGDLSSLLAEGRSAFELQEWPAAIQAFRKVLERDADHPEANSYMGLILAQAGHVDEALAAFDRALAADPRIPIALWGKGLLLYRAKEDPVRARELFERLVALMPPGEERNSVQKILGEMAAAGGKTSSKEAKIRPAGKSIQGTVSLGPKLNSRTAGAAVLFIIARSAGASGPPLAVKKIARPAFPVRYILGPEDSMIPGRALAGKVFVSARLDQDGNPTTRDAGDWTGEHGKNPVEVGADGVDITLDRPGTP